MGTKLSPQAALFYVAVAVLATAAFLILRGPDEQDLAQEQYCEMVELHKHDPDLGWPDFNHNYDSICPKGAQHAR